jgi:hypothetical protein
VAAIKLEVEVAHFNADEEAAAQAHEDLMAAEWRLRQAEARRG